MRTFEEAWAAVADVEGWMTEGQGRKLHAAAAAVPEGGRIVEIGSFRGRSAIVLASAARPGVEVVCIDPHIGSDRGPQEIAANPELGDEDVQLFRSNLEKAGVADRIRHVRKLSEAALADVPRPYDVLYVDGAHRYGPALADIRDYGERVKPGGTLLVHDSFSSVGVTLALLRQVLPASTWRWDGRSRSLAGWVKEPAASKGRDVATQLGQLPWFARNVAVKAAIVGKRPGIARALGHTDGPWPY